MLLALELGTPEELVVLGVAVLSLPECTQTSVGTSNMSSLTALTKHLTALTKHTLPFHTRAHLVGLGVLSVVGSRGQKALGRDPAGKLCGGQIQSAVFSCTHFLPNGSQEPGHRATSASTQDPTILPPRQNAQGILPQGTAVGAYTWHPGATACRARCAACGHAACRPSAARAACVHAYAPGQVENPVPADAESAAIPEDPTMRQKQRVRLAATSPVL